MAADFYSMDSGYRLRGGSTEPTEVGSPLRANLLNEGGQRSRPALHNAKDRTMSMTDAELIERIRNAVDGDEIDWLAGHAADRLATLSESDKIQTAEIMNLQERVDECEEALRNIALWAEAYPLDIFPEPDFKRAHELLKAGGMTLDSISASNMRHVVNGVGKIAREALNLKAE